MLIVLPQANKEAREPSEWNGSWLPKVSWGNMIKALSRLSRLCHDSPLICSGLDNRTLKYHNSFLNDLVYTELLMINCHSSIASFHQTFLWALQIHKTTSLDIFFSLNTNVCPYVLYVVFSSGKSKQKSVLPDRQYSMII